MGTYQREVAQHGNLNAPDLFQSEALHQAQLDESPKVHSHQAGKKLPKLKMPSPRRSARSHQHVPISKRLPLSARDPLQAGAFPGPMPFQSGVASFISKQNQ